MANYLIQKNNFEFVEGAAKTDFDALAARVDGIIAENTTNATGYEIVTLSETVLQQADLTISYVFTIPSNAVVIEAAYRAAIGVSIQWKNEGLKIFQTGTQVQLQVDNYSDAGSAEFKLVYTAPAPLRLDELTDIRVGRDGTVYPTAGDAVRAQAMVIDESFTESGKAADALKTGNAIQTLRTAINAIESVLENESEALSWGHGSIAGATGGNVTSDKQIRSLGYQNYALKGPLVRVVCPAGYRIGIREFSANSNPTENYVGTVIPQSFIDSDIYFFPVPAHYYRYVIEKADDSTILPADCPEDFEVVVFMSVTESLNIARTSTISAGDNLDNYLEPGRYLSKDTSVTASLVNSPFPDTGFVLIVTSQKVARSATTYIRQIAIRNYVGKNEIAIRMKGSGDFNEWYNLAYMSDVESAIAAALSPVVSEMSDFIGLKKGNLYDAASVSESGHYINNSGSVVDLSGYCYTDFIPVEKGKTYYVSASLTSSGALYNAEKVRVGVAYSNGVYDQPVTFQVSVDGFVRLNLRTPFVETFVFCEGTELTTYPPFGKVTNENLVIKSSQILDFDAYSGKKLLCIGDSITNSGRWTNPLKEILGCELYNRGVSGTTLTVDSRKTNSICERAALPASDSDAHDVGFPTEADVVLVLCGANDWGLYNPGTTSSPAIPFGDATAAVVNTTYCGALHYLIDNLKTRYPNAEIYFLNNYRIYSPTGAFPKFSEIEFATYGDQNSGFTYRQNSEGKTFDDYREALNSITSMHGIPVIDLLDVGFSFWDTADRERYSLEQEFAAGTMHDGLHPSIDGGKRMAKYIANELLRRKIV